MNKPTPFLRWAGGKIKMVKKIKQFTPSDSSERRYWEPFLGGGAMFFELCPTNSILSDLNTRLISCYKRIQQDPIKVSKSLEKLSKKSNEVDYYKIRDEFNHSKDSFEQAARFIFLNKTCFNGLFRVNKNDIFNVPYGKISNPSLPSEEDLIRIGLVLQKATLKSHSFEIILDNVAEGDFIYLDPPYPALSETSFFTHYTSSSFGPDQQKKVSHIANELRKKSCLVLISNADTPFIRELYKGWNIQTLDTTRWITCKSTRFKVSELIINNY